MDFKVLREKILPNITLYNNDEVKIIVTKLLDFLIETDEEKTKLEKEIMTLKQELNDLKANINTNNNMDLEKAKEEYINKARIDMEEERIALMKEAFGKIENLLNNIKKKDEENRLYRQHLLTIFKRTIFRFSDSNFYIIRKDDQEFKELIAFFETDELLQKRCEENIASLEQDPEYLRIKEIVESKIGTDSDLFIDNNETNIISDIKDIDINDIHEIPLEELTEENNFTKAKNKAKYLDILNQYKNK